MSISLITNQFQQQSGFACKLGSWLLPRQQTKLSYWTLEQLNVRPYQHLLEVGYGAGNTLEQVARRLKIGFLAGIDHSVSMYRQASRRNRLFIQKELMQLHVGQLADLPYPSQYFHTIYGSNAHLRWNDPQQEFIRLAGLLKSGGRMLMVFQPQSMGNERAIRNAVEKIEDDYSIAGLTDIRIRYSDMHPSTAIAVSGHKI